MSWLYLFNIRRMIFAMILVFLATPGFADPFVICEDMATFSCLQGRYDDGTGSVQRSNDYLEMGKSIDDALEDGLDERTKKIAASYLKSQPEFILKALGLEIMNYCKRPDELDHCAKLIGAELSAQIMKKMRVDSPRLLRGDEPNLRDLKKLLDSDEVNETIAWFEDSMSKKDPARPRAEKKVAEMVPQIKELMVQKINSLPIDEKQKAIMVNRVKKIEFGGTRCDDDDEVVNQLFVSSASYRFSEHDIRICKGYLGKDFSEFKVAQSIGHEIAHSIDPCMMGLTNGLVGERSAPVSYGTSFNKKSVDHAYPLSELLACLRSTKSVGATNEVDATKARQSISYCGSDQLEESVADWFGNEVMTEYISKYHPKLTEEQWQIGISNLFRKICSTEKGDWAVHPETVDRINRIFLQNPVARKKMGCTQPSKKYIYCDASNPDAIHNLISTPEQKRIERIKSIRGVN